MKILEINKREFYYALFEGKVAILDEYGNPTLEKKLSYASPVLMRANVSASRGEADTELFGNAVLYDKVIVTDDMNCPINENTVLCVDREPTYEWEVAIPQEGDNPKALYWYELINNKYVLTDDTQVVEGKTYYIKGSLIYDYVVKRVAKSINSISYAISKVEKES